MKQRYYNEAIECAPIDVLIQNIEEKLSSTDVFIRAANSALYHDKWLDAGINPAAVQGLQNGSRLVVMIALILRKLAKDWHISQILILSLMMMSLLGLRHLHHSSVILAPGRG